jgi:hypothetical protein
MNNLKESSTYLIRFGSSDTIHSITILIATEKAYFIRWNRGIESQDTWELKSILEKNYLMVEDITEKMNCDYAKIPKNLNLLKPTFQTSKEICPICHGMGTVPDTSSTAGRISCPLCQGNKLITTKIEGLV